MLRVPTYKRTYVASSSPLRVFDKNSLVDKITKLTVLCFPIFRVTRYDACTYSCVDLTEVKPSHTNINLLYSGTRVAFESYTLIFFNANTIVRSIISYLRSVFGRSNDTSTNVRHKSVREIIF